MKLFVGLLLTFLVGCDSGSSNPPAVDSPSGEACTGADFDPCTDNSQCDSGNCHLFMQDGFQVCVPSCTPGDNSTCPAGSGANCNGMGICKPTEPNECTR